MKVVDRAIVLAEGRVKHDAHTLGTVGERGHAVERDCADCLPDQGACHFVANVERLRPLQGLAFA